MKQLSHSKNSMLLLAATIFLQSFSFLSLKVSSLSQGWSSFGFLLAAFGFMGLRALFWQHLLRRAELSHIYPYTSLVQVLIFGYAVLLFGEVVEINNLLGLAFMLSGIYFIARGQ
ncbi:hypothetical protein ACFL1C_03425 [Pseudomonadota bacterium]